MDGYFDSSLNVVMMGSLLTKVPQGNLWPKAELEIELALSAPEQGRHVLHDKVVVLVVLEELHVLVNGFVATLVAPNVHKLVLGIHWLSHGSFALHPGLTWSPTSTLKFPRHSP